MLERLGSLSLEQKVRLLTAVERPTQWLAGFAAVDANPAQEVTVDVTVPARTLAHWDDESHAWTIEPGGFHSCEQPADMLCDDDAEPLVIRGVEVDAVVVA